MILPDMSVVSLGHLVRQALKGTFGMAFPLAIMRGCHNGRLSGPDKPLGPTFLRLLSGILVNLRLRSLLKKLSASGISNQFFFVSE